MIEEMHGIRVAFHADKKEFAKAIREEL